MAIYFVFNALDAAGRQSEPTILRADFILPPVVNAAGTADETVTLSTRRPRDPFAHIAYSFTLGITAAQYLAKCDEAKRLKPPIDYPDLVDSVLAVFPRTTDDPRIQCVTLFGLDPGYARTGAMPLEMKGMVVMMEQLEATVPSSLILRGLQTAGRTLIRLD